MKRIVVGLAWIVVHAGCGPSDRISSKAEQPEQPASAAGTSTENGPGVPADFAGAVTTTIPLTQEERDSIAESNAQQAARNPPGKKPTDQGFGKNRRIAPEASTR